MTVIERVMVQSVEWGKRGARINAIAPGIIVTPLAMYSLTDRMNFAGKKVMFVVTHESSGL